jgi:hypothetical protein
MVAQAARRRLDAYPEIPVLVFDETTGRPVDLDLRGTTAEVAARVQHAGGGPARETLHEEARRGPGRPKLGVVAKEVTLLPRHWAWLGAQRGSASATLRRIIDEARKAGEGREAVRRAQDAVYRFLTAVAGDAPGYEAAIRALYRRDRAGLAAATREWPRDLREQCERMAAAALREPVHHGGD